MTTLHDWHHFYLRLDVLLLADVLEAFRHTMINAQRLDCLPSQPCLPSLTLQLALKVTEVQLELITDPDIYLTIESAIRGGLSYVVQRHTLASFPAMSDYLSDLPTLHLRYLDCNSLYHLPDLSATGRQISLSDGCGTAGIRRRHAGRLADGLLCRVRYPLSC